MTRHRLCGVNDLPSGRAHQFSIDGHRLCVVHIDDDWYAIGDQCSHADFSLSEGELNVKEREIECWKHGSSFSLETGEPLTLPATLPVPTYAISVEGDDVMVEI